MNYVIAMPHYILNFFCIGVVLILAVNASFVLDQRILFFGFSSRNTAKLKDKFD